MIRIKDYIFKEDNITEIHKEDNILNVYKLNGNIVYIKDATFEDIEWNYGNNISESLSYDLAKARIEELEEENKRLNFCMQDTYDTCGELQQKIDKAIKLLKEDYFEDGSGNNVEEVIKILKGEENENN